MLLPDMGSIQFRNCFLKMELINFELKFATKIRVPTPSKPVLRSGWAPYEVMDDFKLATMLDPRFKLDWWQNDESRDIRDLLTSQVVRLLPITPAENMDLTNLN